MQLHVIRRSTRLRPNWKWLSSLALLFVFLSGCQRSASTTKSATPSTVTKEGQLTTVELTEAAEQRLGIQTGTVEIRTLPRSRLFGGEVMLPTGATIVVSAPVSGLLQLPAGAPAVKAGLAVVAKQPVLSLLPLALTPSDRMAVAVASTGIATQRAEATGQVEQATTQVGAARIALDRAKRLFKDGAGSVRAVDEADAALTLAEKSLAAALSRKKIVDEIQLEEGLSDNRAPIVIETPQPGIIRAMHVLPGEIVTLGSPLFEVINANTVWIRVPVYVGEAAEIASDRPAEIGELSSRSGSDRMTAEPIAAPPTATALASTLDFYYELPNEKAMLRPGQRVSVKVAIAGSIEQKVLPRSAIVQDIHGGDWVYEQTGQRKFVRRRVQVERIVDSWAVIDHGPPVGTSVVTDGVAEIFGTEFGFDSK